MAAVDLPFHQGLCVVGSWFVGVTLRNAAFTSGWVMSWLRQRFSTRSLLDAPELRQAMSMEKRRGKGEGAGNAGAGRNVDGGRRLLGEVMLQRRESGRVPRRSGKSSFRFASVEVAVVVVVQLSLTRRGVVRGERKSEQSRG